MEMIFTIQAHRRGEPQNHWRTISQTDDCGIACQRASDMSRLLSMRLKAHDTDAIRVMRDDVQIACFRVEDWRRGKRRNAA